MSFVPSRIALYWIKPSATNNQLNSILLSSLEDLQIVECILKNIQLAYCVMRMKNALMRSNRIMRIAKWTLLDEYKIFRTLQMWLLLGRIGVLDVKCKYFLAINHVLNCRETMCKNKIFLVLCTLYSLHPTGTATVVGILIFAMPIIAHTVSIPPYSVNLFMRKTETAQLRKPMISLSHAYRSYCFSIQHNTLLRIDCSNGMRWSTLLPSKHIWKLFAQNMVNWWTSELFTNEFTCCFYCCQCRELI